MAPRPLSTNWRRDSMRRIRLRKKTWEDPDTAQVNGQRAKSGVRQRTRLLLPTAFFETAAVSQHDAAVAGSVKVAMDRPAIPGGKRNGLLGGCEPRQQQRRDARLRRHRLLF